MKEHCTRHLRKGVKKPAEFIIEDGLCETCWIDWWCEIAKDPQIRKQMRRGAQKACRQNRKERRRAARREQKAG